MCLTEALLITIIIILIVTVVRRDSASKSGEQSWSCVDKSTGAVTDVKMQYTHGAACKCPKCTISPEGKSLAENAEHYCAAASEIGIMAPDPTIHEDLASPVGTYAGTDIAYKDLITMQAVDPQVVRNHDAFVRDRLGPDQPQIITGKTYSIGEVEMDSITWLGIRGRPQAIPDSYMGNPTQISDVRDESYVQKSRFNWTSM